MAITTVDDIASGLASAQDINIGKIFTAPKVAGSFQSGWMATGSPGPGVASPAYTAGSGYTCSSATAGAIPLVNGSVQNRIARAMIGCTQPGIIILADRLWSCSGMGFAAGTYTVTTPGALPARVTDAGIDCELFVEQFVVAGAASGTLTANYLNTASAAKSGVIAAVTSAPVAGQLQPVPFTAGDIGISQLTSVVTSATWTSGTFGMTILKRLVEFPVISANIGINMDWAALGLQKIPADACLMLLFLAANTTAPVVIGSMDIIDK
ncbi:MAG: hypothetical protein NTW42_07585 [Deltaproteobacteria bacterium]|nr:hypothetical protein [Deltaproteobacteria bacterium]